MGDVCGGNLLRLQHSPLFPPVVRTGATVSPWGKMFLYMCEITPQGTFGEDSYDQVQHVLERVPQERKSEVYDYLFTMVEGSR
jgi:hypothetical protein